MPEHEIKPTPLVDERVYERPSPAPRVSRRALLKRSTSVAAVAGAGSVATAGALAQSTFDATPTATDREVVPTAPEQPPAPSPVYFNPHQAATVEALVSRIFPGSADDPGAREIGVMVYIDQLLANGDGYAEPIYRQPPFAMTYEGDDPPAEPDQEFGFRVIWVHEDEIDRYGLQTSLTPREMYQRGLPAVDRLARSRFGSDFVSLSEAQQDELVGAMADGEAEGFDEPSAELFFGLLHQHTVEGLFCDPLYGGNRDLAGWRLLGYPGAQRAYTPPEMKREGTDRQPQGLADLPHFHAGRPEDSWQIVQPVRGTERDRREERDEEQSE